ncbi:probable glycosyltransferase At5g03795 [Carica papaya]|uniref:probable glycosyltransferase At5g03795 n=1 Tax=Carica papaya TaxID=3649 RepID=UPI000B8C9FDA|nr:probable glycosyltransferase At5g03795 [Carica papaya]
MSLISRFALFFFTFFLFSSSSSSLYLSPTTLFLGYQKMRKPTSSSSPLPFSNLSTRSISRAVAELRALFPYWNRTLGADHFLISCSGLGRYGDRNVIELNKNSVIVSCFPTRPGNFIPHKDITLPPLAANLARRAGTGFLKYLGYVRSGWVKDPTWVKRLASHADILVESEPSDSSTYEERLTGSRFCLFEYEAGDVSPLGETMRFGWVPVLIADRPKQDLLLMDVLTWQKLAVFVGSTSGVQELKSVLSHAMEGLYDELRESCMAASKHLEWNGKPQLHDAFHMLMYQLWIRRHTIRCVQREWVFETAR